MGVDLTLGAVANQLTRIVEPCRRISRAETRRGSGAEFLHAVNQDGVGLIREAVEMDGVVVNRVLNRHCQNAVILARHDPIIIPAVQVEVIPGVTLKSQAVNLAEAHRKGCEGQRVQ